MPSAAKSWNKEGENKAKQEWQTEIETRGKKWGKEINKVGGGETKQIHAARAPKDRRETEHEGL